MDELPYSGHLEEVRRLSAPFMDFLVGSQWQKRAGAEGVCDFVAGNPQDMALPAYVEAIRRASLPRDPGWFAYKGNEAPAREAAAASLRDRLGIPFEAGDVFLTKGASTALAIALATLVRPGDEVIFVSPPWFFYESMIAFARGVPRRVRVDESSFDLDLDAIAAAVTDRTRAVIVNSPNNPTGRIYPPATLAGLGELLTSASERIGRTIHLLSDEAYNRVLFDGRTFPSPCGHYPHSFLLYSYGKTLLAPGQRLGYLALPPTMPDRERMRSAILLAQFNGYGVPDAVMQQALPELEPLCIDLDQLQRRRDVLVTELRRQGYDVHAPEGTFYLLPRSPIPDDGAFADVLAADDLFVLPGHIVEMPGWFRLCLTATDRMVEDAVPRFEAAIRSVT
ncbi:MAG TPA: aminotransferase class I/II-fold pyridoxal phosphate-dependent enzyme [Acidimicrobiales bacterium]|nr:aminotransferase class I/II-fold pyridoxal phosphate-dependent enzyme [Acidimicrobiales bacterium]